MGLLKDKPITVFALLFSVSQLFAQQQSQLLTLDDCRKMALEHNHKVLIANEQIKASTALKKSAVTQFLPNISANGTYTHVNQQFQMLNKDLFLPVLPFGAVNPDGGLNTALLSPTLPDGSPNPNFSPDIFRNTFAINPFTGKPLTDPSGNPVFNNYTWIPAEKTKIGEKNVFLGGVSLVQPLFTGGKITETYKIATYGENMAKANQQMERSETLYKTEEAYWRVVAVSEKVKLVNTFIDLLNKLNGDLENYFAEGLIVKNDLFKVKVKMNKAELDLAKAKNGLVLAKMALNQQIGAPLNQDTQIADSLSVDLETVAVDSMTEQTIEQRPEMEILRQTHNISKSGTKLMLSRFLPNVGLTVNYVVSNPNPYNGFAKEFGSDWNVGLAVNIPIFHWGDKVHTLNAARCEERVAEMKMRETRELISMQIQQAIFMLNETKRKIEMTQENLQQAEENLKMATDCLEAGTQKTSDVLEAQASWQNAYADLIDAKAEYRLNTINLKKAIGQLY